MKKLLLLPILLLAAGGATRSLYLGGDTCALYIDGQRCAWTNITVNGATLRVLAAQPE